MPIRGRQTMTIPNARGSGASRRRLLTTILVAGIVLIAAFAALVIYAGLSGRGLPWQEVYRVFVELDADAGIMEGDRVLLDGADIGEVEILQQIPAGNPEGVRTGGEKQVPRLGLKLEQEIAPLPTDSVIRVRVEGHSDSPVVVIHGGESDRGAPAGYIFPARDSSAPRDGGRRR